MRKCNVKYHRKKIFYFHQWGLEMCTKTEKVYTVAIMEDEDGEVWTIEPTHITFIDTIEDINVLEKE